MKAMKSSEDHPITGEAEVDETVFGGQEEGVRERKNKNEKEACCGRHREEGQGGLSPLRPGYTQGWFPAIGWIYERPHKHISQEAKVTTDQWTGYVDHHVRPGCRNPIEGKFGQ